MEEKYVHIADDRCDDSNGRNEKQTHKKFELHQRDQS